MLKFESDGDVQLRAEVAAIVLVWAHADLNTRSELLALLAGMSGTTDHFKEMLQQSALAAVAFSGDESQVARMIELGDTSSLAVAEKIRNRQSKSDLPEEKRTRLFARGQIQHLLNYEERAQGSGSSNISYWPSMPELTLTENHQRLIERAVQISRMPGH